MSETVNGVIGRIGWSIAATAVIMVFAVVAALTQYHGVANMSILGYGLGLGIGLASVIIFARWSPMAVVIALLIAFALHASGGVLIAVVVGFLIAMAMLLRWQYLDRHRHHRL